MIYGTSVPSSIFAFSIIGGYDSWAGNNFTDTIGLQRRQFKIENLVRLELNSDKAKVPPDEEKGAN